MDFNQPVSVKEYKVVCHQALLIGNNTVGKFRCIDGGRCKKFKGKSFSSSGINTA